MARKGLFLGVVVSLASLGGLLGACRNTSPQVTALRIVALWTDVTVDQLEFSINEQSGEMVAPPERRPREPAPLTSGVDVVVYFGDQRGDTDVTGEVRGIWQGKVVGVGQMRAHLVPRALATTQVALTALPGSKLDAAGCRDDGECSSGTCADGVCCRTTCAGACLSCNVPGKQGTCSPVPEGGKHPSCADQGAGTCGFDGSCDGHGNCRKYPAGSRCAAGQCEGSNITAARACDGDGQCQIGPVTTCAPFACEQVSDAPPRCFSRCETSDQCVRGRQCVNGSCGTKLDGATCDGAIECTSGFCVDGVCCDSACEGACLSCAQVGAVGICRPVADGVKDPRGLCPDEGPDSCKRTGACNGNGGCARYSTSTVCVAASCTGTVLHSTGRCDGAGTCVPGSDLTCAPFACAGGACNSVCQNDQDCAPGQACDVATRSCGKKGQGQPCIAGPECLSAFCIDGVCCENACQGACRSCALGQTPGRCTNTPAGAPDPRNACKDLGKATCSTDGTCDGRGICRRYPPGTVCGAGSCNATTNIRSLGRSCDGGGVCSAGQTVSCGAYRCNGAVCFSVCSSDAECVAPNTCNAGACSQRGMGAPCSPSAACVAPLTCIGTTCQLKGTGATCTADPECASGHCTDGVCCENGPCAACQSCKVTGFVGFCHALPVATPDPRCTTDMPPTCRQDGTCDGAGACRLYSMGTVCGPASCNGQLRNSPTCDGTGTCQAIIPLTTDCAPFICDPATRNCFTSCTTNAQCSGGTCVSGSGSGSSCN
jgi:hypothetical protein